jgi:hypothetical protein
METKFTLRIDSDLLREARVIAAAEGQSMGALLCGLLADVVRDRKAFYKARPGAVARLRRGLDLQWQPFPDRHSIHDR